MAGLHDITTESLRKSLQIEVPEIFVIIAKHSVLGVDSESIMELLSCTAEDLREVEEHEDYKAIRQYIAGRYAEMSVSQTTGWDQIENQAIENLLKRLPFEKDSEFLLRAAAVANKATRKHQKDSGILDPSIRTGRTVITLTRRLTQRLNGPGAGMEEEVSRLSISDGSMGNPSFDEVNDLLSVTGRPILSKAMELKLKTSDPTLEELNRFMEDKLNEGL